MEHPDVEEFRLTMSGNPYLDEEEKRKVLKALSPEERLARDLGEFQFNRILMYPTFHIDTHGVPVLRSLGDPSNRDDYESEFDWVLRNKQVPTDWTRYMVVDPGNTLCAVLFAAVPPPQFGDYVLLYDELYIRNCDPTKFGIAVHGKAASYSFRAFIMDEHMGRSRHGRHNTLKQVYSHELKVRGIASETTGSWFIAGSDDVPGRCAIVRQWLNVRDSGPPKLRVLRGMCPNLEREFNRYKKEITKSIITDKPAKGEDDLMNCLEYLAAYGPAYYPPVPAAKPKNPALVFREEWLEEKRRRLGGDSVMLGPSSYN